MKNNLASVFTRLETAAAHVEDIAKGILAAIKQEDAATLDHFNEMVSSAYEANGWIRIMGRPLPGSAETPAPAAVKLYVSSVRTAYRLRLDVRSFETMGALRLAIIQHRAVAPNAPKAPELKGLTVSAERTLTGALWHDAVVLWEHLPHDQQAAFEKEVRKLLMRFTRKAPPELQRAA